MKVAIIHDWLTGMRGGEKALEVLCEIFPEATIYTLLYNKAKISDTINRMRIKTSFIQQLPLAKRLYRYYLPLFPFAVEQFKLEGYDLVISSSHCVANGAVSPNGTGRVSYCYTPMRYVWGFHSEYFGGIKIIPKRVIHYIINYLKRWDVNSSKRVDSFVAISENVAGRIEKCYNKKSTVIFPPVDTELFKPFPRDDVGDYFLIVSALVPYKRIDMAVEAFNRLKLPLIIIGAGTEYKRLKKIAGANITFLGWQPDTKLRDYYARCRALIFPGEEDFGIVPLEAQACGRPVIAYGKGGILESVVPLEPLEKNSLTGLESNTKKDFATGIFFRPQTYEALMEAVSNFDDGCFDSGKLRDYAMGFDRQVFKQRFESFVKEFMVADQH